MLRGVTTDRAKKSAALSVDGFSESGASKASNMEDPLIASNILCFE
jgi:hypothetical protein